MIPDRPELQTAGPQVPRPCMDRLFSRGPMSLTKALGLLLAIISAGCGTSARQQDRGAASSPPQLPETAIHNVTETLHGIRLVDPYRWLEDRSSQATGDWIARQNAYADAVMANVSEREWIRPIVSKLVKVDSVSAPVVRGGRYVYQKRGKDEPLSRIYLREGLNGEERVLVDPTPMSPDHTTNVGIQALSHSGTLLAYSIRKGGVDETAIRVRNTATGKDLPDELPTARYFGLSFTRDEKGYYYTRYSPEGSRIHFHRIGTPVSSDKVIYGEDLAADRLAFAAVSENGRWLLVHVMVGSSGPTEIFLKNLEKNGPWVTVISGKDAHSFASLADDTLVIRTDLDAPHNRVMTASAENPGLADWRELIPEDAHAVLQGVAPLGGRIVASYLENVRSTSRIYSLGGKPAGEITFDDIGTFGTGSGTWEDPEVFITFSSFHIPTTIYRYDMESATRSIWAQVEVPLDRNAMVLRQVVYKSKDGTRVPMFLLHRKDLKRDGTNPTLLTGYGGFNVSLTPRFSSTAAAWAKLGGVYAVANLRGGGEFGEDWHKAGMFGNKQNVFDDFIAAGEWLIENDYTSSEHLGIMGGSNGGLLVGACLAQRPDLYGAVVCAFPLLDMVRFQKFLVGRFWVAEYGSSDESDQFPYLLAYSPYHNVKQGISYPATLFLTGDADTRVDPLHARKMTARVQAANAGPNPILLRYYITSGHAGERPAEEVIDQSTETLGFLWWRLATD